MESKPGKEKVINHTFTTNIPAIEGKLMKLGYSFTVAVAENDRKLARDLIREALILKEFAG
jgi:hypothetical protein